MKITKKQVKAIDKGELTVRELFPEVFKQESGWYKSNYEGQEKWLMYLDFELKKCFGFDGDGNWFNSTEDIVSLKPEPDEYKAKPKEVKTALINEAKRRGFKAGIEIKNNGLEGINCPMSFLDSEPIFDYSQFPPTLYIDNMRKGFSSIVFKDGKWAEIITQPEPIEMTVAEIEQKLNINNLKIVKQ